MAPGGCLQPRSTGSGLSAPSDRRRRRAAPANAPANAPLPQHAERLKKRIDEIFKYGFEEALQRQLDRQPRGCGRRRSRAAAERPRLLRPAGSRAPASPRARHPSPVAPPQERRHVRQQLVVPRPESVLPPAAVPVPLRADVCRVRGEAVPRGACCAHARPVHTRVDGRDTLSLRRSRVCLPLPGDRPMKPPNYGKFLPYIEPGYNAKVPFDAWISGAQRRPPQRARGVACLVAASRALA